MQRNDSEFSLQMNNGSDDGYYLVTTQSTYDALEKSKLAERFKADGKTNIQILDLGCGKSPGLIALERYFSKNGIKISYYGVDISEKDIRESEKKFSDSGNATFYPIDASNPDNFNGIFSPNFADLVFCQHPQMLGQGNEGVRKMLTFTLPRFLSPNGYIFISCYHQIEMDAVLKLQLDQKSIFPQDEKKAECLKITRSDAVGNTFIYIAKAPVLSHQIAEESQPENPAQLSKSGLFKKAASKSLKKISEVFSRNKKP